MKVKSNIVKNVIGMFDLKKYKKTSSINKRLTKSLNTRLRNDDDAISGQVVNNNKIISKKTKKAKTKRTSKEKTNKRKKIMNIKSGYLRLQMIGLNLDKIILSLDTYAIQIFDLDKIEFNHIEFTISKKDYLRLLKLKILRNYKIKTLKVYGLENTYNNMLKFAGLIVGVVFAIVAISLISRFTFKIEVLGVDIEFGQQISKYLEKENIKTFKVNNFKNEELENKLKKTFDDISMVSVIKHGTNIIISVKEKESIDDDVSSFNITASEYLVLEKLEVHQGTTYFKVGDIVKRGEVIVYGHIVGSDSKTTLCKPLATIEGKMWYFGRVEFETKEIVYEKTGKKTIQSHFEINGKEFLKSGKENTFEFYEEKHINKMLFDNFLLPVKLNKTIYYETKESVIERNFENVKDKLIKQSKQIAKELVKSTQNIDSENTIITQIGTKYIVQTSIAVNYKYSTTS